MRLQGLDIFRGYALFLMIIFHFSFDLNNFHIVSIDLHHNIFWRYFRFLIVSMFVFSAGISLYLAHKNGIDFKKVKKRFIVLSAASLLVSIGSYLQFPKSWIYFGILHFFLFASLFGLLFLKYPRVSFFLGIFILLGYNYSFLNMHWLYNILQAPLSLPRHYTEDLANVVPWFGVFLLGMAFAQTTALEKIFGSAYFERRGWNNQLFEFLGKHSLVIYLIHQPILFGLFYGYKTVL